MKKEGKTIYFYFSIQYYSSKEQQISTLSHVGSIFTIMINTYNSKDNYVGILIGRNNAVQFFV
jgi:hypothetical protein